MRLIDVQPKDIYVLFEISLSDLKRLKNALDKATIELDLTNPSEKEVHEYVHKEFYPEIVKTLEGMKQNGIES